MMSLVFLVSLVCFFVVNGTSVEQWNVFELTLNGPSDGNPFEDVALFGNFTLNLNESVTETLKVRGFYDGNGIYKIRFMPYIIGTWQYLTYSNQDSSKLEPTNGTFDCIKTTDPNNHGPAHVDLTNPSKFIYSDGTEHFSFGTTSYAWIHQPWWVENGTRDTLAQISKNGYFNKIRMLVFPKWYYLTRTEPIYYPYIGIPPNNWDFRNFNVTFWQHLDDSIQYLFGLNIIADVILFHPYDGGHWGFDCMGGRNPLTYNTSNDDFYLQYIVSRIGSYRNVWWAMANEFDFVKCKNLSLPQAFPTWDHLFETLIYQDPYKQSSRNSLLLYNEKEKSIHQSQYFYNNSRPWVTHLSVQGYYGTPITYFYQLFNVIKPIVWDEVKYEGDIDKEWGNLTGKQETDRFWWGNSLGGYVGHSETISCNVNVDNTTEVLWWNAGNILRGQSYKRIGWFAKFMMDNTNNPGFNKMNPYVLTSDNSVSQLSLNGSYYLVHFSYKYNNGNGNITIKLTNDKYIMSYIDYFNMSIVEMETVSGNVQFNPPSLPYNLEFKLST